MNLFPANSSSRLRLDFGVKKLLWVSFLALFAAVFPLRAATPDVAPPTVPPDRFANYLVDNQDILGPFFSQHADDLVKQGLPFLLSLMGDIILLNLLIGWAFDVGMAYGFSTFFAPAYAKVKQALIYATGRLVLGIVVGIIFGLVALGAGAILPALILAAAGLMLLVNLVAQSFWIGMIYRTNMAVSVLFYLALVAVHLIVGALVSGPIIKGRVSTQMTQFFNQNVTPQLKTYTVDAKHDLSVATSARDKAKADIADAQGRIAQAAADSQQIAAEIEQKKTSEVFTYGRIVRTHAEGDLVSAQDQLKDFLTKFPSGSMTSQARTQLALVESEMAAQDAQKKQDAADAAAQAAAAQADLLARAGQGNVTLSEMRNALFGKSRDEVSALFGKPAEVASDRWGYSQSMIVNPLTGEKHGLAVYFQEGAVQGVDYYYGGGTAR